MPDERSEPLEGGPPRSTQSYRASNDLTSDMLKTGVETLLVACSRHPASAPRRSSRSEVTLNDRQGAEPSCFSQTDEG